MRLTTEMYSRKVHAFSTCVACNSELASQVQHEDNTTFQTFHICAWLMCEKEELVMSDSRLLG